MNKMTIKKGEKGKAIMPFSEVCMYMKISGKEMEFKLLDKSYTMVQLYKDKRPFSTPILPGEAGIYEDIEGYYYYTS